MLIMLIIKEYYGVLQKLNSKTFFKVLLFPPNELDNLYLCWLISFPIIIMIIIRIIIIIVLILLC